MSLGTLSNLYRNTKSKAVKRNVATAFGTDYTALVERRGASAIQSGIPFNWDRLIARIEKSCGVEAEFRQKPH